MRNSSTKNPDQPNKDRVNGYDVVQNPQHNQDQDSRNQKKERAGQGVMNRHFSTPVSASSGSAHIHCMRMPADLSSCFLKFNNPISNAIPSRVFKTSLQRSQIA
jgi:hypothetical protein